MRERKRWQEELTVCDCSTLLYMLESMNRTKASALDGPKPNVLLVAPLTFAVASANGNGLPLLIVIPGLDDRMLRDRRRLTTK